MKKILYFLPLLAMALFSCEKQEPVKTDNPFLWKWHFVSEDEYTDHDYTEIITFNEDYTLTLECQIFGCD